MSAPLGVGIIGAGPVTQAIHVPTLSTLRGQLQIMHVMDVDETVAAAVAARAQARATTSVEDLLEDPAVEVVAVCSPNEFHAGQIEAAADAGKRGVLCEKPLATTVQEARRIADISRSSGMPVVVGTMHAYDPAWAAVRQRWGELPGNASLVRSTMYLPPNDEFIELATDPVAPARVRGNPQCTSTVKAPSLRPGVLGLATHVLPQVRQLVPKLGEVTAARVLAPFGYRIIFTAGDSTVELVALTGGDWSPYWALDVWGLDVEVHVEYPPSYVLAGSATARMCRGDVVEQWRFASNGYQAEWTHLAEVARQQAELMIPVQEAADDLLLALELVDRADRLLEAGP